MSLKTLQKMLPFVAHPPEMTGPYKVSLMMKLMIRVVNLKTMPLFDGNCMTTMVKTSTTKSSSSHSFKGMCKHEQNSSHRLVAKPLEKSCASLFPSAAFPCTAK